jgi:hypothetical protein
VPIPGLSLPELVVADVAVSWGGQRSFGNAAAAGLGAGVWQQLEGLVVDSQAVSSNWLDGLKQASGGGECCSHGQQEAAGCFGEPIQLLSTGTVEQLGPFSCSAPGRLSNWVHSAAQHWDG